MTVINEVESGTNTAQRTAETLEEVVQGVGQIADVTEEAEELAKTQAEAMRGRSSIESDIRGRTVELSDSRRILSNKRRAFRTVRRIERFSW